MSQKEAFSAGQTREFYGDGDFFRLLETTAGISVEFYYQGREIAEMIDIEAGYAESFARDRLRFDRIRIYSATAQNVKWVIREGSDVRYDRGAASITGSVDLNAATVTALGLRDHGASWSSLAAVTVNAPLTVFAPGANVKGAIILSADMNWSDAANSPTQTFISKAGVAPAAVNDGAVIVASNIIVSASGNYVGGGRLPGPQKIPAGEGLYFISGNTMGVSTLNFRACRYRLL